MEIDDKFLYDFVLPSPSNMVAESTGIVLYYIYLEVIAIRCSAISPNIFWAVLLLIFSGKTKNKE